MTIIDWNLGLPHVSYFPFDSLEASVALPDRIPKYEPSPGVQGARRNISTACGLPSQKVVVPKESGNPDFLTKIDLKTALQYGTAEGYPPLHSFIRQFVRETLHPDVPFRGGPEIVLTCGSTDGFSKTIEAFTDVWDEGRDRIYDRQGILCEEFAYMNAIQTARPRGLNIVPVAVDSYGMSVSGSCGLEEILENWDFSLGRRPHLMYTVTWVLTRQTQHLVIISTNFDVIELARIQPDQYSR